jgi:hypothetical protein
MSPSPNSSRPIWLTTVALTLPPLAGHRSGGVVQGCSIVFMPDSSALQLAAPITSFGRDGDSWPQHERNILDGRLKGLVNEL